MQDLSVSRGRFLTEVRSGIMGIKIEGMNKTYTLRKGGIDQGRQTWCRVSALHRTSSGFRGASCGVALRESHRSLEFHNVMKGDGQLRSEQAMQKGRVGSRGRSARCHRLVVRGALLDPPRFNPRNLQVFYLPGVTSCAAMIDGLPLQRKYTLTHNDFTGSLKLSIGVEYNKDQLSGWYTRILRDEILAEWSMRKAKYGEIEPVLHVYCHVSGEEKWPAPPGLRSFIFQREMKLVLDTIVYADRGLLAANPALANASVYVHLASNIQPLNQVVSWGQLGDGDSWQQLPQGSLLKLLALGFTGEPVVDAAEVQAQKKHGGGGSLPAGEESEAWVKSSARNSSKVLWGGVPSMLPAADLSRQTETEKIK